MTELLVTAHRPQRRASWAISLALLPAIVFGTTVYFSSGAAQAWTELPPGTLSPVVPVQAVPFVTAPGSVADYDPAADITAIEIILPPPPPPPSSGRRGGSGGGGGGGSSSTGARVDFCAAGGGATAQAYSFDEMVAAANVERAQFGYQPLSWSGSLASASQSWASQLAANDDATAEMHDAIAHNPNRPRGGENVAMSFNGAGGMSQSDAILRAHLGWMQSFGHCKNMLNPNWSVMGAGSANTGDSTTWYTVVNYQ